MTPTPRDPAAAPPPYWCHLCDRTVRSPTDGTHDLQMHLERTTT